MRDTVKILLLFFLIFAAVYSPVLYFNYLFHDDASFWVKLKEHVSGHIFFNACVFQCRYGDALLLSLENFFVHKVPDLKLLRFLSVVISSGTACLLFRQMRRLSFSDIQAFLVIAAMFFLPGFAAIIFYGISSAFFALCIFLSCWSFCAIEDGKKTAVAAFVYLFAITIYPTAAMFYWTMLGMVVLFAREGQGAASKNNIFRLASTGLTALLIYAVSIFFMHYFFAYKTGGTIYDPYVITRDWPAKLQWFFQEPVGGALNLWDIFPKAAASMVVSGFIAVTALVVMIREGIAWARLWRAGLLVLIFFLTFLPNLAAQGNAAFYRCLVPLSSLIWLFLVWAILKWRGIFPKILTAGGVTALLSLILVFAGATTFHNILYDRVLPSHIEYNAYRSMARAMIRSKKINALHIVLPRHHLLAERWDEFGVLSSHYVSDLYPLVSCAFNEAGLPGREVPLIYFSYPGDDMVIELKKIFIKDPPVGGGLSYDLFPLPVSFKRTDWYVLNLNDVFGPLGYEDGDGGTKSGLAAAYNNRGNIYFKLGNLTRAIADYTKAVGLKPDYQDAYFNLGFTYYKQGNLKGAISSYQKAVELNPKDTQARNNLAVCFRSVIAGNVLRR